MEMGESESEGVGPKTDPPEGFVLVVDHLTARRIKVGHVGDRVRVDASAVWSGCRWCAGGVVAAVVGDAHVATPLGGLGSGLCYLAPVNKPPAGTPLMMNA